MSSNGTSSELKDQIFILVTGANSGLGFSICCRLADEFLQKRPATQHLTVIFTARGPKKGKDTLARLQEHLRNNPIVRKQPSAASRVTFEAEDVDLTELLSVRALSRRLLQNIPKLDAIVLNAGYGGWTGIDWFEAVWKVMTDTLHAVSWPTYKLGSVGMVTKKQTSLPREEPRLGAVFCANVFGHYMLAHNVVPLLNRSGSPNGPGRIIWVSSLEATIEMFNADDIQGLRTDASYESSKSLTDVLALTSDLPSTAPWVNSFLSEDSSKGSKKEERDGGSHHKPNIYVTHPGICGTSIVPLILPAFYSMLFCFWFARMLGSPWHTISTYFGACASVWAALSEQSVLDDAEAPYRQNGGGHAKWGSSVNRRGVDRPVSSEVEGWGHGGVVGVAVVEEDRLRRRKRGARDLTVEDRQRFEELGRRCWKEMEELRIQWDGILDEAEAASGSGTS
ncbi:3-keto-steroid reductase [Paecilomyces lecythidis]